MSNKEVRVRFAPSPTGALHIGGAHTALFNWLWARKNNGKFVLRIEDTDRQRSTKEYEKTILDGLKCLGLYWDEGPDVGGEYGPYRQSERLSIYREHALKLLEEGKAYKDGEAIIFRVPKDKVITFNDIVYGEIQVKSDTLKDIVLIKSDGTPTYNYAVVVDDHYMCINYVIRGEDHIANTPKQILIYEAFGWELPQFAHLPMILGKDKKKFSKRHGATSVFEYKDMGYLPEAVVNFLALLGWGPGDDREILSLDELISLFDLKRVIKRASVFDMDKLNHINHEYIKAKRPQELFDEVVYFWEKMNLPVKNYSREYLLNVIDLVKGRAKTIVEIAEFSDYFLSFDVVKERFDIKELPPEKIELLKSYAESLSKLEPFTKEALYEFSKSWAQANDVKLKEIAMPLRFVLTGRKVSPGIFEVAELMGKEEVLKRLKEWGIL